MKKANLLWLASIALVLLMNLSLASCGSDDDDDATPDTPSFDVSKIYGTWQSKSLDLTGIDDEMMQMLDGAQFVFDQNGKGAVTIPNQLLTSMELDFTWAFNGDVLHITIMAMAFDFQIKEFTDNEIHFTGTMTRAGEELPLNVIITKK